LTIIGAILVIVGEIIRMINNYQLNSLLVGIVLIFISLILLDSTGMINIKIHLPFRWFWVLVMVIIQAVVAGFGVDFISLTGLGLVLEIITIILLIL
jgi:hypothetical protein